MKGGAKLAIVALAAIVVVLLVILAVVFFGGRRSSRTGKASRGSYLKPQGEATPVSTSTIYEKDGVTFEHFWPLDVAAQHLKADESEIVVHNRGSQSVEFSAVGMDYFIGGSQVPHYSGTWEKFPDDVTWEKIEYINISPLQYKGEKLALAPGQKCKIHYHYQVQQSQSQNPDQKVRLNLAFTIAGSPYKLDQELVRKEPPRAAPSSQDSDDGGSGQGDGSSQSQGH